MKRFTVVFALIAILTIAMAFALSGCISNELDKTSKQLKEVEEQIKDMSRQLACLHKLQELPDGTIRNNICAAKNQTPTECIVTQVEAEAYIDAFLDSCAKALKEAGQ